jgi:PIN domain nuclease of toxin-antitoxin system
MKLLLDTHTLLWAIGKSNELSEKAIQELKNVNNDILVSAISLWEIALKYSIGKLIMDSFEIENIPKYCEEMGFEFIPLEPVDALNSLHLPQKDIHKDPFDRMLIYQCIKNEYIFASKDTKIKIYKESGLKYIR